MSELSFIGRRVNVTTKCDVAIRRVYEGCMFVGVIAWVDADVVHPLSALRARVDAEIGVLTPNMDLVYVFKPITGDKIYLASSWVTEVESTDNLDIRFTLRIRNADELRMLMATLAQAGFTPEITRVT